jgi:hypothetical protein
VLLKTIYLNDDGMGVCDSEETIEHLFLACCFAKVVCHIVYFTYNIPPPTNIKNKFENWLNGIDNMIKVRIRIGVSVLCWSIWNCHNNIFYNRARASNF